MVRLHVVDADFSMLFGATSLENGDAIMKFWENSYISLPKAFGDGIRIPLGGCEGHYTIIQNVEYSEWMGRKIV